MILVPQWFYPFFLELPTMFGFIPFYFHYSFLIFNIYDSVPEPSAAENRRKWLLWSHPFPPTPCLSPSVVSHFHNPTSIFDCLHPFPFIWSLETETALKFFFLPLFEDAHLLIGGRSNYFEHSVRFQMHLEYKYDAITPINKYNLNIK